jgi:hypothetical protein
MFPSGRCSDESLEKQKLIAKQNCIHLDMPSRIPTLRLAEGERGVPKARRSCAFWGAGVRERLRCCIGSEPMVTPGNHEVLEPSSLIVCPNHF